MCNGRQAGGGASSLFSHAPIQGAPTHRSIHGSGPHPPARTHALHSLWRTNQRVALPPSMDSAMFLRLTNGHSNQLCGNQGRITAVPERVQNIYSRSIHTLSHACMHAYVHAKQGRMGHWSQTLRPTTLRGGMGGGGGGMPLPPPLFLGGALRGPGALLGSQSRSRSAEAALLEWHMRRHARRGR